MTHRWHKQVLIRKLAAAILADPTATVKQKLTAMRMVQKLPDGKAPKEDKAAPTKETELGRLLKTARKKSDSGLA